MLFFRKFGHVKEVTLFKEHDALDSIIVQFSTNPSSEGDIQIKVPLEDSLIEDARLTHLSVGVDFDPKEQVFRNFIRLITTKTRPDSLRGRAVFSGGKTNETYKMSWLSPAGQLVAVNYVDIDANAVIAELDIEEGIANLATDDGSNEAGSDNVFPLMPGVWWLVCSHRDILIHSHAFLVLPKYPDNGIILNDNDIGQYKSERLDNDENGINNLQGLKDIPQFLAKYVPRFYNVSDYCFIDSFSSRPCSQFSWSYDLNIV